MTWIKPPERKPIGVCPVCGDPVLSTETDTKVIDVPPVSPEAPQVITMVPGPLTVRYWPCRHEENR